MGKPGSGGKAGKLRKAKAKQQQKNNKRRVKIQKGILPNSATDAPRKEQGKTARAARYEHKQPADKKVAKEARAAPKGRGRGRVTADDDSPARPVKKPKLSAAAAEDKRTPALSAADLANDVAAAGDEDELQKQQAVLGRFYGLVDPAKTPEEIVAILDRRRGELPAVSPADFSLLCAKLRGKYKIDPVTLGSTAKTAAAPAAPAALAAPAAPAAAVLQQPAVGVVEGGTEDLREQASGEAAELQDVVGGQPGTQPGTETEGDSNAAATAAPSANGAGSALQQQVDDALADGARDTAGQLNALLRELAEAAETKALIRIWDKLVCDLEGPAPHHCLA
eukprot:SAG22_NODE_792_length_7198_cov_1.752641_7_plen_337_part_00